MEEHVPSMRLISPHMSRLVASSSDAPGAPLGASAELWDVCHLNPRSEMQLVPKFSSSWPMPRWQGPWFGWDYPHTVSEVTEAGHEPWHRVSGIRGLS